MIGDIQTALISGLYLLIFLEVCDCYGIMDKSYVNELKSIKKLRNSQIALSKENDTTIFKLNHYPQISN